MRSRNGRADRFSARRKLGESRHETVIAYSSFACGIHAGRRLRRRLRPADLRRGGGGIRACRGRLRLVSPRRRRLRLRHEHRRCRLHGVRSDAVGNVSASFTSASIDTDFAWGGGFGYRFTDYFRADATVDGFRADFDGSTSSANPCLDDPVARHDLPLGKQFRSLRGQRHGQRLCRSWHLCRHSRPMSAPASATHI